MAEDLVTVETFASIPEAEAARIYLENEDVTVVLTDAEMATLFTPNTAGGVKLQVPPEQAERAAQLIAEHRAQHSVHVEEGEEPSVPGVVAAMTGFQHPVDAEEDEDDDAEDETEETVCLSCGKPMKPDDLKCSACGWSYETEEEGQ